MRKVWRKGINTFVFVCLCTLLCLCAACNSNVQPNENDDKDPSILSPTAPSLLTSDLDLASSETLSIEWGYYQNTGKTLKLADSNIVKMLNERFNIDLSSRLQTNASSQQASLSLDGYPDIFKSTLFWHDMVQSGNSRTIPRAMIEQYAPNYAALINSVDYGWDLLSLGVGEDECFGLPGYIADYDVLSYYSVYRLDWLEALGIAPKGDLTQIEDRLYFTDKPFTQDELVNILNAFTTELDKSGMILTGNYADDLTVPRSLTGLFGLNFDNINESGNAVPYYASQNYKDYVSFLSRLNQMGVMKFNENPWYYVFNVGEIGWWSSSLDNLHNGNSIERRLLSRHGDAKVLITPPEIGYNGLQGAPISTVTLFLPPSAYFIRQDVSDEKLARILTMYDQISFDPELYTATFFGVEGKDFTWAGEPYNSKAVIKPDNQEYTYVFSSNVRAEDVNQWCYFFGDSPIVNYALSPEGRSLSNRPYKVDLYQTYFNELLQLREKYSEGIAEAINNFYANAVIGGEDISELWDNYRLELQKYGLDELIALYNLYAYTN